MPKKLYVSLHGKEFYPSDGAGDWQAVTSNIEAAKAALPKELDYFEWVSIIEIDVETLTHKTVFHHKRDAK